MKATDLNEVMKYIQKKCTTSAESSRTLDIERMKIEREALECLTAVVAEVQKRLEKWYYIQIYNNMTQRRQVGFIKTYIHNVSNMQQEPSEFSYFRLKPKEEDDEFSPYKF